MLVYNITLFLSLLFYVFVFVVTCFYLRYYILYHSVSIFVINPGSSTEPGVKRCWPCTPAEREQVLKGIGRGELIVMHGHNSMAIDPRGGGGRWREGGCA